MRDVLDAIDRALKEKGLSRSAVSQLATGNPATLKNLHATKEDDRQRRSTLDNVRSIAEFLGLEFYVGPPRVGQLAEQAAKFSVETPLDIRWIPLDPRQAQALVAPPPLDRLAVPRSWLKDLGIAASSATLVVATDDAMAPAIGQGATAVLDTSDTAMDDTGAIRAVMIGATVKLRRLEQGLDWIIARPDNPRAPIDNIPRRHAGTITILGRVRAVISTVD
jgi:SOS-response transcriptional repressor LexA